MATIATAPGVSLTVEEKPAMAGDLSLNTGKNQAPVWDMSPITEEKPATVWEGPSKKEMLTFALLAIVSLVIALDATIISTTLNDMVNDVGGTETEAFWVGTAYLIASAVSMPLFASLSDIFGRRPLFLAAVALFVIGTALCSPANSITLLLGGRGVQGVGGGGMYVLCLVVFTDTVPPRLHPKWYGVIQAPWAVGTLAGPIIGGAIVAKTTWRWIFYLNFPICAVALVGVVVLVGDHGPPAASEPPAGLARELARIDWFGQGLFTVSVLAVLVAVSWGGSQYAWSSPAVLVPLLSGIVGVVGALVYESRYARRPFLRRSLFKSKRVAVVYSLAVAQGLVLYAQIYYVPYYFIVVRGYSPTLSGAALLPTTLTLVPVSIASGWMLSRNSASYWWFISLGWVVTAAASGLLILLDEHTSMAQWIPTFVLAGVGHGCVLNAQTFVTRVIVGDGHAGHAAATYLFMRTVGAALGVNMASSAFQNFKSSGPFTGGDIEYVAGFKGVHLMTLIVAAIALPACIFVPRAENTTALAPLTAALRAVQGVVGRATSKHRSEQDDHIQCRGL